MDLDDIFLSQINTGIFDKESIRKYNQSGKRAYRLVMAHYFVSAFISNEQEFNWAHSVANTLFMEKNLKDKIVVTEEFLEKVKDRSLDFLSNVLFMKISKNDTIDDTILNEVTKFLQSYIKNSKTIFLYKDLLEFWDLQKFYSVYFPQANIKLSNHHLIELKPFQFVAPVHTFPEFYAYQDLINLWNETLIKYEKVKRMPNYTINRDRSEYYSFNSLLRTTLVSGVHFFEVYLYYIYYNFRSSGVYNQNKLCKRTDVRSINDKNIIKELLYTEYPQLKTRTEQLYLTYLETLEFRDAFVHMSAFTENGVSRLQYLVDINFEILKLHLNNIINFVDIIEEELSEHNILFWKDMFEWPDFSKEENISNLKK